MKGDINMSIKTIPEMLKNSINSYPERIAFKVKENKRFVPITYKEFYSRVVAFGTGLHSIGIKPFDHIGLVSENRFEWIISDMAIIGLRAVDVPCSGASSSHDIHFKLKHSDSVAAILEGEKQFADFYSMVHDLSKIKTVILLDKIKLFSEKTDIPEWSMPVPFQDGSELTKVFNSEIELMVKNTNKYIFLSKKAKKFLEEYLRKNTKKMFQNIPSKNSNSTLITDLLKRAVIIENDYNQKNSLSIFSFEEINRIGKKQLAKGNTHFSEISKTALPEDLVTIIYTSGTTADPKGVMLLNSNFAHNLRTAPPTVGIKKEDRFLSILPSWHIYERTVEYCALTVGASTAYSKPYKQVLLPDLKKEKPTVMCSVPRIWESVYKGIMDKTKKASGIQKMIFNWAINTGKEYKEAEGILNNTLPLFDRVEYTKDELAKAKRTTRRLGWKYRLADRLVFEKIREITGGELRFAISGGGALTKVTDVLFNIVGLKVCEGYGLTETSPIISGRVEKYNILFTVGPPLPEVEIKIVDKDNYNKKLPHGQIGVILVKGPLVMKGYYKNEKKTREVIKDSWFNTGDLGKKTKNGEYLKIVGRIKNTIVLRGGENIEPLPLEDKLKESIYINMSVIVGQDKPRLGALIVPDFDALAIYTKKENIKYKNNEELIKKPEIIALYQKEQKRLISKENGFKPYETVMGISLLLNELSVEAGEMTETLKIKRFEVHKKYKKEIDKICG